MGLREVFIDAWSWLDYKPIMADAERRGRRAFAEIAGSWVPEEDFRRLAAYKLLAAYDSNLVGPLAAASGDESARDRRELGDAAKLNETALGYLLGAEQTIVVPGAEHADDEDPPAGAQEAAAVQQRLRAWAQAELFELRMQQAERAAVRYGDGVYTLAWEPSKQRVVLRTMDPGFYFPEWPEEGELDSAEFPQRVHFAWELPEDRRRGLKARLRRITYELGPVGARTVSSPTRKVRAVREASPEGLELAPGDRREAGTGRLVRSYPWSPGEVSAVTCYLSDAEWLLDDLKGSHDVYRLPAEKARYRVRSDGEVLDRLDLMIDFIPVVHVTNTVPDGGEHWGEPTVAKVLQAVDELAATDTDAAAASATTGSPILALAGASLPVDRSTGQPLPVRVQAGQVFQLGENGRLDAVDTAGQLAELRARTDHLLNRIATTSRLTPAGLGTLDPAAVPSGYALQLYFGPLDSLVSSMRLARAHKYGLLLKMVQRLHQAGRVWPGGEALPARVVFGPHTPTDRTAVLEEVVTGYQAGVFSLETAVRMLMDAGYPIEDASQEIDRIESRAFEQAARLADATGDNGAVRDYLGLPEADAEVPPVPLVPGPGAAPGRGPEGHESLAEPTPPPAVEDR